jgi:hypothetical protein
MSAADADPTLIASKAATETSVFFMVFPITFKFGYCLLLLTVAANS